jgi:hypothetical protein
LDACKVSALLSGYTNGQEFSKGLESRSGEGKEEKKEELGSQGDSS